MKRGELKSRLKWQVFFFTQKLIDQFSHWAYLQTLWIISIYHISKPNFPQNFYHKFTFITSTISFRWINSILKPSPKKEYSCHDSFYEIWIFLRGKPKNAVMRKELKRRTKAKKFTLLLSFFMYIITNVLYARSRIYWRKSIFNFFMQIWEKIQNQMEELLLFRTLQEHREHTLWRCWKIFVFCRFTKKI